MVKKIKNTHYYEAVGRRKEAVARVRLYIINKEKQIIINSLKVKQGDIIVNNKPITDVFSTLREKAQYLKPLKLTDNEDRFAVSIHVEGGGRRGQLEALVMGLARAIEKSDKETYRPLLKKAKMLTRDSRTRERRKVGTGGKSRRAKQSPKR